MKPRINDNQIELFIIEPVFKTLTRDLKINGRFVKDSDGKKIKEERDKFVKEIYLKKWMDKRDISTYGQFIGSKGEINKSRCEIYNKTEGKYYRVAHTIDEIKQVLQSEIRQGVGFKPNNNEI
jgi:hypothetical protein